MKLLLSNEGENRHFPGRICAVFHQKSKENIKGIQFPDGSPKVQERRKDKKQKHMVKSKLILTEYSNCYNNLLGDFKYI